jgi:hypothetical protein
MHMYLLSLSCYGPIFRVVFDGWHLSYLLVIFRYFVASAKFKGRPI